MRLSPHFTSDELRCKCCGSCEVTESLVAHLEVLRAIVGAPLRPVSGYRCERHNRRVGGARSSQHVVGKACDLPRGYATVDQARRAGFTGIGRRGRWAVHVDVRNGPPARWVYGA